MQFLSRNLETLSLPPIPGDAWQVGTEGMGEPIDEQVV